MMRSLRNAQIAVPSIFFASFPLLLEALVASTLPVNDPPHPIPLPLGGGEGVRRTGEGAVHGAKVQFTAPSSDPIEFFERKIRPILVERCYECHSADAKKLKGGLRLDTKAGWTKGGDSGPAIIPGTPDESLLIKAIRSADPDAQMPPKGKLPDHEIAALIEWVKLGAPQGIANFRSQVSNRELQAAHWAYLPPKKARPPEVADTNWPRTDIDRFILARLEAKGLRPVKDADPPALARRAYYDLIGLLPTPDQIDAFANDAAPDALVRLVDRLLQSPHFGERWGRHWLDVVRFGESVTLRGLVFKEAWRYRDYVIDAFNRDQPFNQFIQEQVAGDLLLSASLDERRRRLIATTFLALGNTVLEEQDKAQLRMDVVDEQLDTLGKAFLAQTLGCARCHDHKFDPIPTRDYYALAGILRSTKTLAHANVSNWIELPLPIEPEQEAKLREHEGAVAALQAKIKSAKEAAAKLAASAKSNSAIAASRLAPRDLPGVVVDDLQAKRVGEWKQSQYSGRFIGDGYLHDLDTGKGEKTLTFHPELPQAGKYEVRLAYVPGFNRSSAVPVTILSADGETVVHVNEQEPPALAGRFVSLGQFRFEQNNQGYVLVSNEGTQGHVIADAVQFIPIEDLAADIARRDSKATKESAHTPASELADELPRLEAQLKSLTANGPKRPMVMSVQEEEEIGDTRIHIRGSVHNLGEKAPRGFLRVATHGMPLAIPDKESGRRQLGEWLASPSNPLTARVIVNRVWHWLVGAGLVRTVDNFGTTGELPSHPELLDYLAVRFMEEGWSVKKLVREMMLSRVYQLGANPDSEPAVSEREWNRSVGASGYRGNESDTDTPTHRHADVQLPPANLKSQISNHDVDPENRLLWRMNRRRLDAECIRDTILFVSGQLNLESGGATIKPGTTADYGYQDTATRRSVYVPVLRNALPEIFEVFDFANPSVVSGARNVSTGAPQALFLMNHPFVLEQARRAAQRIFSAPGLDLEARIRLAYRTVLGRLPSESELAQAARLLDISPESDAGSRRQQAWAQFYQALFASPDFRYVN